MQKRAEQTRRTILLAAATIFDKYGYAAASIDQIIEEAGVTKGALYFHFISKAELAQAVVARQYEVWDWEQASIEAKRLPPLDHVDGVVAIAGRLLQGNVIVRAGMRLVSDVDNIDAELALPLEPWVAYMQIYLEQAQREGAVMPNVDAAAAARALVAGLFGVQQMSAMLYHSKNTAKRLAEWWTQFMRPSLTGSWPDPTPKAKRPRKSSTQPGAEAALVALNRGAKTTRAARTQLS
jgi:AcrR family transcriptional regulator